MKNMLAGASERTLVLIDEFGSGTEPTIGGAIAEAILERLLERGCYGVITTHYANIKYYASNTQGIVNGAMMFDVQQIRPLFRLEMGKPGSSFAVEIARKIGLPEEIIR
jgi:DNA mismatch repair protein MutS2